MAILSTPEGGTPEVIVDPSGLRLTIDAIARGSGPIAIDAERASGYRYSSRAYLIQLFRRGGGLHLIDPIPLQGSVEVSQLSQLIGEEESVIHASSQDLPCLREFGLHPKKLFDTELGARIAGFERVGLGPLCESLLGITLAKEHSAVDWSIRPLRKEWLDYAALDVALLVDIRDLVEASLIEQGKLEWSRAEFAAALTAPPPAPRRDPWRRTSGMHQIRSRFELAIIRELWVARDRIAAELDVAPGRLLSDSVIVEFASRKPQTEVELQKLPIIKERIRNDVQRQHLKDWWQVLQRAYQSAEADWPEMRTRGDSLPPPRIWRARFPLAFAHLQHARKNLAEISARYNLPPENLISPEILKRVTFDSGKERPFEERPSLHDEIRRTLESMGARTWQIELAAPAIAHAMLENEPPIEAEPAPAE